MEVPFFRAQEGKLPPTEVSPSDDHHSNSQSESGAPRHEVRFVGLKDKSPGDHFAGQQGVDLLHPTAIRERQRCPSELFSEANDSLSSWKQSRKEKKLIEAAVIAVPNFSGESHDAFTVQELTGGLTNQLYLVRHMPTDHAVVVRVYGKKTSKFISRESEQFWQSVFLKTHGRVGDKILVYEFLDGYRVLDAKELLKWQVPIARKLAETHACATSAAIFTPNPRTGIAGIGSAGLRALLHEDESDASARQREMPSLPPFMCTATAFGPINHTIAGLTEWVDQVRDLDAIRAALLQERPLEDEQGDGQRRVDLFDALGWDSNDEGARTKSTPSFLIKERDWLLSVIQFNISKLPTAVCHNDLLHGNIMVKEPKSPNLKDNASAIPNESAQARQFAHELQHHHHHDSADIPSNFDMKFIDFEYTRRNYAYFDIANHFNEYAGVRCEFEHFPTRAEAEAFIKEYLLHGRKVVELLRDPMRAANLPSANCFHPTISPEELKVATDLIFFFTLVSNFIWAVWSVLQATTSEIDFSYLSYAAARWKRYLDTKEAFSAAVTGGMEDGSQNAPESAQESLTDMLSNS